MHLLEGLECTVPDDQHTGIVYRVAIGVERESTQNRIYILGIGHRVFNRAGVRRSGFRNRVRENMKRGVRKCGPWTRFIAVSRAETFNEGLISGCGSVACPTRYGNCAFCGLARGLYFGQRQFRKNQRNIRGDASLAGLDQ